MAAWQNMATELYVDNHDWLSTDITDFSSAVTAFRLDQFALPISNLNLNGQRWTNSAAPVNAQDLTTKQWVLDSISGSALSVVGTANQINVDLVGNTATISIADNPIISGNLGMIDDIVSNTNSSGIKTSQSISLTKSGVSNDPTIYFGTGSNGILWNGTNFRITNHFLPNTNNSFNLGNSSFNWSNLFTNNATINALTASQAVVTNGSKQLASLAYSTSETANSLVQRDANSYIKASRMLASSSIRANSGANDEVPIAESVTIGVDPLSLALPAITFGTGSGGNKFGVIRFQRDGVGFFEANYSWYPLTNNAFSLGASNKIWSNLFASNANFYGTLSANTANITGSLTSATFECVNASFTGNVNLSALTASQAVVTNGSKQLASLAYSTSETANTLAQRDGSGRINVNGITCPTGSIGRRQIVLADFIGNNHQFYGMGVNTGKLAFNTQASGTGFEWCYGTTGGPVQIMDLTGAGNLILSASGSSLIARGSISSSVQTYYVGFGGATSWDINIVMQAPNSVVYQARCYGWGTYSSKKLKDNISPIKDALSLLNKIEGVEFTWKEGQGDNVYHPVLKKKLTPQKQIGFIAEDVAKILPSVCLFNENDEATSMDYSKLVPLLVEAVKQLSSEVKSLRS